MSSIFSQEAREVLKRLVAYQPEYEARIRCSTEQHRKGALKLEFQLPDGTKVERCRIRYRQLDHEFKFGANAFMFRQFVGEESWKNQVYEEKFKEIFNAGVVPFYWDAMEPTPGQFRFQAGSPMIYRRPATDELLEFMEANGITPKGHPLIWHTLLPQWLPRERSQLLDAYEEHIATIAQRYGKRIRKFDVYNEGLQLDTLNPDWYKQRNVPPEHIERLFDLACKYFPSSTELIYNEGPWMSWDNYHGTYTPLYMLAKHLKERASAIRGLGLQYHIAFFGEMAEMIKWSMEMLDPAHIFGHMDLYGSLGVPLNVSEITIPAMEEFGDGEAFQELVTERMYRMWFSHPAMNAITWWNMVDGTAYCPDSINNNQGENRYKGGLLNNDMTEKRAYKVLRRLIREEWHSEGELEYQREGVNKLYGYYGNYQLEVEVESGTYQLQTAISKHQLPDITLTLQ